MYGRIADKKGEDIRNGIFTFFVTGVKYNYIA